jgi:hypothetical protein
MSPDKGMKTSKSGERESVADIQSPLFLDERELARITKRSLASIRRDRLLRRGCPYRKINSSVRYLWSDVQEWIRSLPTGGAQRREAN